jgi:hypothetical protein
VHAEHTIASRSQPYYNQPIDPFIRLSIWLWQLSRRRLSRQDLLVYAITIILALGIGLIEWAGTDLTAGKLSGPGCRRSPRSNLGRPLAAPAAITPDLKGPISRLHFRFVASQRQLRTGSRECEHESDESRKHAAAEQDRRCASRTHRPRAGSAIAPCGYHRGIFPLRRA